MNYTYIFSEHLKLLKWVEETQKKWDDDEKAQGEENFSAVQMEQPSGGDLGFDWPSRHPQYRDIKWYKVI